MEGRPVARRGSALAILLAASAMLGALLVLCAAQFSTVRDEAEDSILYGRLEAAARGALEEATAWIETNKPAGPLESFEAIALTKGDSAEQLDIALPESLASFSEGEVTVSVRVQWCVFTPSATLVSSAEFPPAIGGEESGVGLFRQTYESSLSGAVQNVSRETGAWRIIVISRLAEDGTGHRRVRLERVVVLDR